MSLEEIDIVKKETKENQEEDDLEEGELKDDDDDDDDDEEDPSKPDTVESSKSSQSSERQSSSSSSSSPASSSSSSSSSSSDEEEGSQSRASSKVASSYGQPSRSNDSSFMSKHMSGDRYRPGRNRDREDPKEKAAKLISMRTKLLEAKSREIEMKFAKNKSSLSPAAPLRLLSTISTTTPNLKMTLTKPSISFAENPKPLLTGDVPVVTFKEKKSKKSKKRKKKKSKSSTKKHKKHKSSGTPKKKRSDSVEPNPSRETTLPSTDNGLHQGPKTPPDNVVVTLDDERIEWPSHLIRMTTALPSISYSVNPDSVMSNDDNPPAARKRRSLSSSTNNFNSDFQWFCDHFTSSFEMDHNQAQHQAYIAMLSSNTYDQDALDKWLSFRGFTRESSRAERIQEGGAIPLRPIQPGLTILKSQKEVILPNGQVLPPGTVQKVVHPYARLKDGKPEILGAYYDLLH